MAAAAVSTAQQHQLFLYDDPHSEYCAKVKVALHYKGLKWQTLPVAPCTSGSSSDSSRPASRFQQQAPLGKIPALVIAPSAVSRSSQAPAATAKAAAATLSGEVVLYESEVINEWLEEAYPQPPMLPQDPLLRAQARLISRFHDLYLEPALRKLYPHVAPSSRSPGAVAAASKELMQHLQHLDRHLLLPGASLAVGNHLSLADCAYPGLLLYAQLLWPVLGLGQLQFEAEGLPRVAGWHRVLCEQPAVKAVLQELQPAAEQWVASKMGSSAPHQ